MKFTWLQTYVVRLRALDLLAVVWGTVGAMLIVTMRGSSVVTGEAFHLLFPLLGGLFWVIVLYVTGSYNSANFGAGVDEYRKVVQAGFAWLGVAALAAVLLNLDVSFLFLLFSFVLVVGFVLGGRWLMRKWLVLRRVNEGLYCSKVLVFGEGANLVEVAQRVSRAKNYGYDLVGVAIPTPQGGHEFEGIRLLVTSDPIEALRVSGADTLVLAGGGSSDPDFVREISWRIDSSREALLLAEALVDVAGPRIQARYVPNLSLVGVSPPTYPAASRVTKRVTDLLLSIFVLVVLSPVFVVLAIAIKLSSPGPVFYHQDRVGYGGKVFKMYKFRSMVANADDIRASLLDDPSRNTNEVLFKMKDDPRVTPVGRFMRRHSLDELPQFANVLGGTMSVVGPRPPLIEEVLNYAESVKRKFLVRPGITGLWQVSGRSDLNWEQSLRFDMYYVENWSFIQDLQILWRTFRVVFTGKGAY